MLAVPGFARRAAHPCCLSLILAAAATGGAHAVPLDIGEAGRLALGDEPGAAGFEARAQALRDEALAAGELPDPTVRVGLMNFPIEAGGFSTEGMTQVLVGVRQPLPTAAGRTARAERTDARADEAAHRATVRRREVLRDARIAWLDAYRWQQARTLAERSRREFTELVAITESAYAVGRRSQHDLLQAELELTRLDDRLARMAGSEAVARAELARWIGAAEASRPVSPRLPDWSPPLAPEALASRLAEHPLLAAATAGVAAEEAAVRLARSAYRPDWGIDVNYGYRDGRLANGRSRSDFFSVMLTMDMPVFGQRRQDRQLAASRSDKRAAIDRHSALARRLSGELAAMHATYASLDERIAFYDDTILARSQARAEAALAAYQSGAGDFNDLVRSRVAHLDVELDRLNLAVDRARARVRIAWLTEVTP